MTGDENEFGVVNVSNDELTVDHLPPNEADWHTIELFALTFDGYSHWGSTDKCAEIANDACDAFRKLGQLPESLVELRTCLFFEQRRHHHFGEEPKGEQMKYMRAILMAIRQKVAKRNKR